MNIAYVILNEVVVVELRNALSWFVNVFQVTDLWLGCYVKAEIFYWCIIVGDI